MIDPFKNRTLSLNGPAADMLPVTPSDASDLAQVAVALYIETAGTVSVVTATGQVRSVKVASNSVLPVGVRRVRSSGTTASGIHAFVVA